MLVLGEGESGLEGAVVLLREGPRAPEADKKDRVLSLLCPAARF